MLKSTFKYINVVIFFIFLVIFFILLLFFFLRKVYEYFTPRQNVSGVKIN